MRNKLILIGVIVLLTNCSKHSMTVYSAKLINKSSVDIQIIPYRDGVASDDFIIKLKPSDSFKVGEGVDMGFVNQAGFDSEYFMNVDFVVVKFNNYDSVFHYLYLPETIPSEQKYYNYSNNRNILNMYSYHYFHNDISKKRRA